MKTGTTTPVSAYEPVTIELGGRTWPLFASFYAIKRIKELTSVDLRDPTTYGLWLTEHIPAMVRELIQTDPEAPSVEELEMMMDLRMEQYLIERIFEAVGVDIHGFVDTCLEAAEAQQRGEDPLEAARRMKQKRARTRRSRRTS